MILQRAMELKKIIVLQHIPTLLILALSMHQDVDLPLIAT